jgi:MscS family membrane protein
MLEKIIYDNSVADWGISILIIIGALLLNRLIIILNRKVILKITAKSKTRFNDLLFNALEKPVLMGVILLAIWIATKRLLLGQEVHESIAKSYDLLVVLNFTWFFSRFATALIEHYAVAGSKEKHPDNKKIDTRLLPVIKRSTLIIIWFIGIVTALHNVGIQATTLLGTLGIGGIAFALAAQDTIKNIFGGFTIFTDKTFRIGDTIQFDSVEGKVVDIGLRSTRIRNYDKRLLTIPNYKLTDAIITNISSEPGRRVVMELGLTYQTSSEKMQEAMRLLEDIPNRIPEVSDRDLTVFFTDFKDSALIITFVYFIRKTSDIFATRSKVNLEILRSFNQAGLDFAFPTRTLHIEKEY